MANEIEIVVTSTNKTDLGKVEADAKKAGKGIGDGIEKGFKDAEQASDKTTKKIKDDLDKTEKKAKQSGEKIKGAFEGSLGGVGDGGGFDLTGMLDSLMDSVPLAGKVGVAIGGALLAGITAEWEETAIGGMIAAQNGAASSEAGHLGNIAGDIFANNFGESVEEVGDAMTAVFQNNLIDTSAPESAIRRITEAAMTSAAVVEEEVGAVARAAQQLLVNDLAGSAEQAFDLITVATQQGLNASGDLLDTITEYSPHFRQLGLSGGEAMDLISDAMQGGARDTDYAADALKEFVILSQDAGSNAARGFESIGLSAKQMTEDIGAGGSRAHEALRLTLDGLRAIENPVLRNQAAVDLFGTKAEDLGASLYSMDLNEVADEFGNVAGATDEAGKAIGDNASQFDKWGRGAQEMIGFLGEMINAAGQLNDQIEVSGVSLGDLEGAANNMGDATGDAADKELQHADAMTESNRAGTEYLDTIDSLISAQQELAGGVMDLGEAHAEAQEAISEADAALKEFAGAGVTAAKDGFDLTTEAGRELQGQLFGVAESGLEVVASMQEQGAAAEEVQSYMEASKREFIRLATGMGLSSDAAQVLADKLYGIPDEVVPSVRIQDFASAGIKNVVDRLNNIPNNKNIYVYLHQRMGSTTVRDLSGSYQGRGGQAHGGITPATAETGGARGSWTTLNEQGPEVIKLPNGSTVATAGATRALGEAGAFGGDGGATEVVLSWDGSSDPLIRAIFQGLRAEIKNRHGGSVTAALGQRGAS